MRAHEDNGSDVPRGLIHQSYFIPSLQGLRVIAMTSVALQNLYSYGLVTVGWTSWITPVEGLYIFVALSGFVLTWRQIQRPLSWRGWFARRLVGLYSIYLTVVVATVFGRWLLAGEVYALREVLLTALGLQGLFPSLSYAISGPWWYVALLLQLYLLFPLVYRGVERFPGLTLLLAAVVSALSIKGSIAPFGMSSFVGPYLVMFAAGAVLARVSDRGCSRKQLAVVGIGGALVFTAMVMFWFGWWQWWFRALALALACIAFFELVWLPRPLLWLGALTPAFFFVHQEPMRFVTRLPEEGGARLAVWLVASLALSWVLQEASVRVRAIASRYRRH